MNGDYCFPRKLIKGCLRQAWSELQSATGLPKDEQINAWLGIGSDKKSSQITSVDPVRGRLLFDDFVAGAKSSSSTTRIKIDEDRDAVDEGALQTIELPYQAGEEVEFIGRISYFAKDKNDLDKTKRWVALGLRWITNLGALENVNFGQLLTVAVIDNDPKDISFAATRQSTAHGYLDLTIKPESPFCIAKKRVTENLFESDRIIPGGVLKGAFAITLLSMLDRSDEVIGGQIDADFRELGEQFSKIRFTHAFPAESGSNVRSVQPPQSLIKDSSRNLYDAALFEGPFLVGKSPEAPAFYHEWKRRDDVEELFGWVNPDTKLQVQTAIKDNHAEENKLYAYEVIIPSGIDWYARIDLRGIDQSVRPAVEAQIRMILKYGLRGLGKTKTRAAIQISEGLSISDKIQSNPLPFEVSGKQRWIITMQTPSLLCDPFDLNEQSGSEELMAAYKKVWTQVSGGHLKLAYYYASQSLSGGTYLHNRFLSPNPYNPYLLTDAGSIFVLEAEDGKDAAAQTQIQEWIEKGLPLPEWTVERFKRKDAQGKDIPGNHWSNCPYVPEAGYGEIAVNLSVHWDRKPKDGECHEIS